MMETDDTNDLHARLMAELAFSRNLRMDIIQKLAFTDEGLKIPAESDDKALLAKMLDGLDKLHLSTAKLKVEERASQQQHNVNLEISEILRQLTPARISEHFQGGMGGIPNPDQSITTRSLLPGEADQGIISFRVSDFLDGKV